MNKRLLDIVKNKYPDDVQLHSAVAKLVDMYGCARKIREITNISIGAWYNFIKGNSRTGLRNTLVVAAIGDDVVNSALRLNNG